MVALLVLSGIEMLFFGILGEYTGRTFLRVNNKPQAAIREVVREALPKALEDGSEIAATEHDVITGKR
jgi:hypothetical protein